MEYNFNIFNSIILTGIIQGFVFVLAVLFSKKFNKAASTRFLTAVILICSLNNLSYYLRDIKLATTAQFYVYLYFPLVLLFPPLFYFYVKNFLSHDKKTTAKEKLLYLPFVFFLFFSLLYKIGKLLHYENSDFLDYLVFFPLVAEYIGIIFLMIILIYCLKKIIEYEKLNAQIAGIATTRLRWLKLIIISLLALQTIWIYDMLYLLIVHRYHTFYWLWIGISVMIYWLGHIGIYKYGIEEERRKIRNYSIEHRNTYSSSEKQKSGHISTLEDLMVNRKYFLDASLTLEKLAEELKISKSHLSRIINAELGTSFSDYLNTLRVEEAKSYLTNPEFSNYTLVAIGLEAGFNSKSSFNNAFKKITGTTPSEFKKLPSN